MRAICLLAVVCATLRIVAEPIEFREIAKGSMSGLKEPTRLVVTNETQWSQVWQKHSFGRTPKPPVPKVNFKEEMVLFVTLGQRNTGGYSVAIQRIEQEEGKVVVHVDTKSPAPGAITLQVLTAPFHVVAAKTKELPVSFKIDGKVLEPSRLPVE